MLKSLDQSGPTGHAAATYALDHAIQIGFRRQSAGARWTPWNRIDIHPRYAEGPADSPYALSLVVHELRHLQQGWMTALSVYGELDAWQCQFGFLESLGHRHLGEADRNGIIVKLMSLSLDWDRPALGTARALMRAYAGKTYRVDLLPLYPLHWELLYRIAGRLPTEPPLRANGPRA